MGHNARGYDEGLCFGSNKAGAWDYETQAAPDDQTERYEAFLNLSQESNMMYTDLIQQIGFLKEPNTTSQSGYQADAPVGGFMNLLQLTEDFENNTDYSLENYLNDDANLHDKHDASIGVGCNSNSEHNMYMTTSRFELDEKFEGFMQSTESLYDSELHHVSVVLLDAVNRENIFDEEPADIDNALGETELINKGIQLDSVHDVEQNADKVVQQSPDDTAVTFDDNCTLSIANSEDMAGQKQNLTEEDIQLFLHDESISAAVRSSQEGDSMHVPKKGKKFRTDKEAISFYQNYALIVGFSTVKATSYISRKKGVESKVTRQTFKCQRRKKMESSKEEENEQATLGDFLNADKNVVGEAVVKKRK
ncbi:uncharacterized protein LOC107304505 [Oryza brachyantha]|nr:uncharacterized protein LOC107304505 [Oryza brachyantha]